MSASGRPIRESAKAVKTLLHRIALTNVSEVSEDEASSGLYLDGADGGVNSEGVDDGENIDLQVSDSNDDSIVEVVQKPKGKKTRKPTSKTKSKRAHADNEGSVGISEDDDDGE
jgi:hypothetical protein